MFHAGYAFGVAQCALAMCLSIGNGYISTRETPDGEARYQVRLTEQPCAGILAEYARVTGFEIEGKCPAGTATFDCGDEWMTFEAITTRLSMVLFDSPMKMWLSLLDDEEFIRITPLPKIERMSRTDQYYDCVSDFAKAEADPDSIALVRMAISESSKSYIRRLQNWAPSYISIVGREGENAISFFGIAKDVRQYLQLARLLDESSTGQSVRMLTPIGRSIDATAAQLHSSGLDLREVLLEAIEPIQNSPLAHRPGIIEDRLRGYSSRRANVWFDPAFGRIAIRAGESQMHDIIKTTTASPDR